MWCERCYKYREILRSDKEYNGESITSTLGDQGDPHRRGNLSHERMLLAERWQDVKRDKGRKHHRMDVDETTGDQEEECNGWL